MSLINVNGHRRSDTSGPAPRRERSDRSGAGPGSLSGGALGGQGLGGRWVDRLGELGVAPHPVAVAADVDDVAAVEKTVQQGGGHDLVVQDSRRSARKPWFEVSTVEVCS